MKNKWPITRLFLHGVLGNDRYNDGYVGKAMALSGPYNQLQNIIESQMIDYVEYQARITLGWYWDKETL